MSKLHKKASLIGTIENLLDRVSVEEKVAGVGETTHPSKSVDDGTQAATEGARSSENEKDIKAEPNLGQRVNDVAEGSGPSQEEVQSNMSVDAKPTGEAPAVETSSTKDTKDDPGSSHPARTDNPGVDKYSSDLEALRALAKKAEEIGSDICAEIAVDSQDKSAEEAEEAEATETEAPAEDSSKEAEEASDDEEEEDSQADKEASDESDPEPASKEAEEASDDEGSTEEGSEDAEKAALDAAQAGYDLAGVLEGADLSVEDKQAADAMVVDTVESVLTLASRRAEKCAEFYAEHFKAATEGDPNAQVGEPTEEAVEDSVVAETSEDVEGDPADEAGAAPIDEAAILDLLAGGEGMGGEEAVVDMAGGDAALPPEEGLPVEGGIPGEGGDELAMLEAVLAELGVSPEALEVAASDAIAAKEAAAKQWQPKTAADKEKFAQMKAVVEELVARSSR